MAWDLNRVVLIGRLTKDIELKYTPAGKAVCNFSIAVGGMKPDQTSFIPIVVWEKSAENVAKYLKKGSQLAVDGRLNQRPWTDKDGNNRSTIEVQADRIEFIGGQPQQKKSEQAQDDNFYDNTGFDPAPVDPLANYGTEEPIQWGRV